MKKPYEYTRDEFYRLLDEFRPPGADCSHKYNGKTDWQLVKHIDRIKYMSYDVHKWLFNKALNGCTESLFKIEYNYDLYTEVINKYNSEKEKGLI